MGTVDDRSESLHEGVHGETTCLGTAFLYPIVRLRLRSLSGEIAVEPSSMWRSAGDPRKGRVAGQHTHHAKLDFTRIPYPDRICRQNRHECTMYAALCTWPNSACFQVHFRLLLRRSHVDV